MRINLGIIGGNIASIISKELINLPEINLYAVASRSLERAESFSKVHGFKKAYGSYEKLLKDENVDLVYIATPHSHHYEHMMLCLSYNKNIICEKAFTLNQKEAEKVLSVAKQKHIFVTEAMCTAYQPSQKALKNMLPLIGEIKSCNLIFGVPLMHVERVVRKELGGGALLDLGVYPLYFTFSTFGKDFEIVNASIKLYEDIDEEVKLALLYKNGIKVNMQISVSQNLGYYCNIIGSKGRIYIENFGMPKEIIIFDTNDNLIKIENNFQNGYKYEFLASINALKNNQVETKEMPHQDTLFLMGLIDKIKEYKD